MTDPAKFLERTTDGQARLHQAAVEDLFTGYVTNDRLLMQSARRELERVTTEAVAIAELVGASTVLQDVAGAVDDLTGVELFRGVDRWTHRHLQRFAAEPTNTILPRVTFEEAVQDFVDRTPTTIRRAAERTAQRISELYGEKRVVAFARAAEASVTRAAQDFITDALRTGIGEGEAGARLAMRANEVRKRSKAWTESYARMAFRTNVNTAVTAGRFRQANDSDVKAVAPAFIFRTVGDVDVRPNHAAMDGVILRVDNTAWRRLASPLGYNCRCGVDLLNVAQLRRMGRLRKGRVVESRIPAAAGPDAGFRHGGRPDLLFNGLVT